MNRLLAIAVFSLLIGSASAQSVVVRQLNSLYVSPFNYRPYIVVLPSRSISKRSHNIPSTKPAFAPHVFKVPNNLPQGRNTPSRTPQNYRLPSRTPLNYRLPGAK
jgi:hypothetical protein